MIADGPRKALRVVWVGLAFLAILLGSAWAVLEIRSGDRYVTVKGVAEREVKADLCVWPIKVRVAKDNLEEARQSAEQERRQVLAFLEENGIPGSEVASQRIRVTDRQAGDFAARPQGTLRYVVEFTIVVRSRQVEKIEKVGQMTDRLVAAGVVLSSQGSWDANNPQFLFTQLNSIKPEMMAEATRAAHDVAGQFAADSGSQLGKIRRASQGVFSIGNRDQVVGPDVGAGEGMVAAPSEPVKKVRVVVTVDYLLR